MEVFIFEHDTTYVRLYNCSVYSVEDVPLAERQHLFLGAIFITLAVVFEALSHHLEHASYQLMFVIGVLDMCSMVTTGFMPGLLGMQGAVFCSSPTANYWLGILTLMFWMAESSSEFVLALNRCRIHTLRLRPGMALDGRDQHLRLLHPVLRHAFLLQQHIHVVILQPT